ncbi:MAG: flavin reductase family protein [Acidobacteriota bacterium]|nr:flavin reductase family protein [Acidobacteriota bacterium]
MSVPSARKLVIDLETVSAARRYHFMISAIVPRPIAWVSTRGVDGTTNLAPFSFFQGVCSDPPTLMISFATQKKSGERKDTLANIEATREFVVNLVSEDLLDPMILSSAELERGASEIEAARLATFPGEQIEAPCLVASPVNLECRLLRTVPVGSCVAVFGRILLAHARSDILGERGTIDPDRLRPVARLGGSLYALYGGAISKKRP